LVIVSERKAGVMSRLLILLKIYLNISVIKDVGGRRRRHHEEMVGLYLLVDPVLQELTKVDPFQECLTVGLDLHFHMDYYDSHQGLLLLDLKVNYQVGTYTQLKQ
jgi:hypothetical protein